MKIRGPYWIIKILVVIEEQYNLVFMNALNIFDSSLKYFNWIFKERQNNWFGKKSEQN